MAESSAKARASSPQGPADSPGTCTGCRPDPVPQPGSHVSAAQKCPPPSCRNQPRSVPVAGVGRGGAGFGLHCAHEWLLTRGTAQCSVLCPKKKRLAAGRNPAGHPGAGARPDLSPGPGPRVPAQGAAPRAEPSCSSPCDFGNATPVLKQPTCFLCYTFKGMLQFYTTN